MLPRELVEALADIASVAAATIRPDSRLDEDLGMDSLDLLDLACTLNLEVPKFWRPLTVGEIAEKMK